MDSKRNNEMILLPIQSVNEVIDLPVLAVLLSVVRGASEVTALGTTETMIKWHFFIFQLLYNYNFFCLEDFIDFCSCKHQWVPVLLFLNDENIIK